MVKNRRRKMSFGKDEGGETGDNESYALSTFEQKELEETRSFTRKCESKIAGAKKKFDNKSALVLWWDAKGIFNSSNAGEITNHMERYESFYKEIDTLSELVEKGDRSAYERLLDIYRKLEEIEKGAKHEVKKNNSSAVCKMLREFLKNKYELNHNLKKVECVVLKQKMSKAEKSLTTANEMIEKFGDVEKFMETMRKKQEELARVSDERLKKVLEETEERYEARIRDLKKRNNEMRLEADKRSEAIRRESDEKLKQVLKEAEDRAETRIQEMRKQNEEMRLEAEKIRRESDEKLKQAVEEANRRSEARMLEMAEHNRATLQKMTKILEDMNVP